MLRLETQDIALITAIQEAGSISRAADRLFLSQPTVSKRLARLEVKLGVTLFHRAPTGLIPTDVARYVIESASPISDHLRRIERHVQQMTDLDTGEIRIGVGPIIEQVLLPDALTRLFTESGEIQVTVVIDRAARLLSQLERAELDLIAGPFRVANHPALYGRPLIEDQLVTVARAGHPVFDDATADLAMFPLAGPLPQGLQMSQHQDETTARGKRLASDNYPLLKSLVMATDTLCLGPWHVFREELAAGLVFEVPGAQPVLWQSACLTRAESAQTPLVSRLMELLLAGCEDYWAGRGKPASS